MRASTYLESRSLLPPAPLKRIREAEEVAEAGPLGDPPRALQRAVGAFLGPNSHGSGVSSVLSGNKFLLRDPVLRDPALNRRGLHVLRAGLSRAVACRTVSPALLRHGIVVHHGFSGVPELVLAEARKVPLRRASKAEDTRLRNLPALRGVWEKIREAVFDLLAPGRELEEKFREASFVQWITSRPGDRDRQKLRHSDTFFPAFKWWLFPEAVELGAFEYASGSPSLSEGLCDFLRRESCRVADGEDPGWRGRDHLEGSFRASAEELEEMGLETRAFQVPEDTLVIANVAGFHRRGDVSEPTDRISLHGSIRSSRPFEAPR